MKLADLIAGAVLTSVASVAHATLVTVDPDAFLEGTALTNAFDGITLTMEGRPSRTVMSQDSDANFANLGDIATTGSLVFGYTPSLAPLTHGQTWDESTYGRLRVDFARSAAFVQIDLIFDDDDVGGLWAYDTFGNLLDVMIGSGDGRGPVTFITASISRNVADIAYVLAGGVGTEGHFLDNLQYSLAPIAVPEPSNLGLLGAGLLALGLVRRRSVNQGQRVRLDANREAARGESYDDS